MTGSLCAPLISAQDAKLYDLSLSRPRGAGGNVASLQRAVTHCGFFDNPSVDFDGVYRRVPLMQQYDGAIYPSLALSVAQLRSEEHTSELQSLMRISYAVFCLKKKQ